jgi:hypothetical protein
LFAKQIDQHWPRERERERESERVVLQGRQITGATEGREPAEQRGRTNDPPMGRKASSMDAN